MRTVFFGTSPFAAYLLRFLLETKVVEVVSVVTRPDKPAGRKRHLQPTAVKQECLDKGIATFHQPHKASTSDFIQTLANLEADLFIVVAYGEILSQPLLDLPTLASINIHASLLPKYRGAAPIQRCLMDGEPTTGITIMHMTKELDAGDVILQLSTPLTQNTTFGELEETLKKVSCEALSKALLQFQAQTVTRTPQSLQEVSYAKKITSEDQVIDWGTPAQQIHNHIRALSPKPGAWTFALFKGEKVRLKILKTDLLPEDFPSIAPGELILSSQKHLCVGTLTGALRLEKIQLPGKKPLSTPDFLRGHTYESLQLLHNIY